MAHVPAVKGGRDVGGRYLSTNRAWPQHPVASVPVGQITAWLEILSSPWLKNIPLAVSVNQKHGVPILFRREGRYVQSSRNVGQGAVDATLSCAQEVAGREIP